MRKSDLLDAMATPGGELDQVLALLSASGVAQPRLLSVADGDRWLLALLREMTGRDLESAVTCPACGAINSVALAPETVPPQHERVAWLRHGGLRAPTYGDLCELPRDAGEARRELARRCVVGTPVDEPDPALLDLVDDALTGPLVIACTECGQGVTAPLDVERAILEALRGVANELEVEIHLLARTYHWDLPSIEALPDERRARLAELVESGR